MHSVLAKTEHGVGVEQDKAAPLRFEVRKRSDVEGR